MTKNIENYAPMSITENIPCAAIGSAIMSISRTHKSFLIDFVSLMSLNT